jgi:hypothetical protein
MEIDALAPPLKTPPAFAVPPDATVPYMFALFVLISEAATVAAVAEPPPIPIVKLLAAANVNDGAALIVTGY